MAVTLTNSQLSAGLYSAFWNRAPDATGQNFWVGKLNGGMTSLQVATEFYNAPEGLAAYPNWIRNDNAALVTQVYNSVFERAPDAGGLAFYVAQLNSGTSFPQVVLNMMANAVNSAAAGNTDGQQFLNEIQVGIYVSEVLRTNDPAITSIALEGVTYQQSSVEIREAQLYAMTHVGETYVLTTGIDQITGTPSNDTFDASFAINPQTGLATLQTLNAYDSLNGNGGVDTLNAQISADVTPLSLQNIELVNVTATVGSTLGLLNAGQLTNVTNNSSSADLVVTNIAAGASLAVANITAQDIDTTFDYATVTGTQSANLVVNNLSQTGADHTAAIVINGVETVNVVSTGSASSYVLDADAATTVTLAGAATQNVRFDDGRIASDTKKVTLVDASASTGTVNFTVAIDQSLASADLSVLGGVGNDTLDVTAQTTNDISVTGGLGNDTFVFGANLANTDTIVGGEGVDTLSATSAALTGYAAVTPATLTGVEAVTVSNALVNTASLTLSNLQAGINTVNLAAGTAGTGTITFDSGVAGTVNVAAATGGLVTVVSAGAGTTDALTVANTSTNVNVLAGNGVTATGVETLTLNLGSSTATDQTTGAIAATSGTTAVVINGNNNVSTGVGVITAGSVNASGLTGTAALTIGAATVGVTSITGSANADTLVGSATATTILAGAGNDNVTGGAAADSIDGQEGNDVINGGAGNDTIHGGAGNDTITVTANTVSNVSITGGEGNDTVNVNNTLAIGDSIDGGAGVNTLRESVALIAPYAGVVNFQTLQLDGTDLTQNMANFTGTTFTRTDIANTGTQTLTNVGSAMQQLRIITGTTLASVALATDTAADTLTIGAQTDAATTVGGVTANDIETLTIGSGADTVVRDFQVTTLTDADLVTLNVTGNVNFVSALADQGTTEVFTTLNAASNTGTVVFDASLQDITGITMTGSSTAANTLTGGAGNDNITGGSAADTLSGGNGNDLISGGAGSDSLSGGAGVDTLVAGTGSDSLNGGAGADSIVIGATGQTLTYDAGTDSYQGGALPTSGVTVLTGTDVINFSALTTTGNTVVLNLTNLNTVGQSITGHTTVQSSFTALANGITEVVTGSYNTLTGIFTAGAATSSANADVAVVTRDGAAYNAVVLQGTLGHNVTTIGIAGADLTLTLA